MIRPPPTSTLFPYTTLFRSTTERNTEQDWLKTNLAKFSRMMQGQRDLVTVGKLLLSELAPLVEAQQGIVRSEEHTSELQSQFHLVCRLLLEKKKKKTQETIR